MTKSLIFAAMTAFLAVSVRAADFSGVWSLRLQTKNDESAPRASVTLKQDGEKLTGSCKIDNTDEMPFTVAGQVKGDSLNWQCVSKGPVAVTFKGSVNTTGREMTGTWTTGKAEGTFKGSRPVK
jgi:hypothetical protein